MHKKLFAILVCLGMLLSFAACGPDTTTTAAPTEPTAAPTEPTAAPTEPTAAPTEPTAAPTEPTAAPTEPTAAPTEPTAAPTEPTAAPTEPTAAPTEPTAAPTEPTENISATHPTAPPVSANGAFDTENIVRISFYLFYGAGVGGDVPAEYMEEVTAWLGTFTVGEEVSYPLRPGTNTMYVEIEYADGTVIKNGTDTIKIDETEYFLEKDKQPDCIAQILAQARLE